MRFHRFLKDKQSMKSTSTDEGIKPERVDKMDGKGRGDEKKSPRPACFHDVIPPPGETLMSACQFQEILYVYDVVLAS